MKKKKSKKTKNKNNIISEETNIITVKKSIDSNKYLLPFLFCVALLIIIFRSMYTFSGELLFTEDGTWLGQIYRRGFWNTLWHAKGQYLVFGNIIALKIADILNWVHAGDNLTNIPIFVALVQYCFYAFCAIIPIFCFRKRISFTSRFFCYIMIVLLPFGDHDYEIFGKVSNIGYLFYFVAFALLLYRMDNKENLPIYKLVILDIAIFLCPTTNPLCYALVGLFFIADVVVFFKTEKESDSNQSFKEIIQKLLKKRWFISWIVLGVFLLIALIYIVTQLDFLSKGPESDLKWNFETIIEFFAREIIYPFVFTAWKSLTTNKAIVILAVMLSAIIVRMLVFYRKKEKEKFNFYLILILASILYVIITMLQRSVHIIPALKGYELSFPDRYHYAQNVMWICCFSLLLEPFAKKVINVIPILLSAYLAFVYISGMNILFRLNNGGGYTGKFRDCAKTAFESNLRDDEGKGYVVPIKSQGWTIWISEEQMYATIRKVRSIGEISDKVVLYKLTDNNWNNGVLIGSSTLLFESTPSNYINLFNAKNIVADGVVVPVTEVTSEGTWIHVLVDTPENAVLISNADNLEVSR